MYSMTAFARATIDTQGHHLIWELKSVNHRFLETSFRMPEALRIIEHPLRERLRKRLSRGKVECNLRIEAIEATDAMALNQEKLDALIVAIEHVRQHTANTAPVDPLDLLRWPGVMSHHNRYSRKSTSRRQRPFRQSLRRPNPRKSA